MTQMSVCITLWCSCHLSLGSVSCYILYGHKHSPSTSDAWDDLSHVTAFGEMQRKASKRSALKSAEYFWLRIEQKGKAVDLLCNCQNILL